jgi:type IV pilus assembly protein PilC
MNHSEDTGTLDTVKLKDLSSWLRQWSALQKAGLSQLDAMSLCVGNCHAPALRDRLERITVSLQQGRSMSESMAMQAPFFPPLVIHLSAAAEQSGKLDETLEQMAGYFEQKAKLLDRIRSSLMYPLGVLLLACAVVAVILAWVVPVFEENFRAAGAALPLPTQIMVKLSRGLRQFTLPAVLFAILTYLHVANHPAWRKSLRQMLRNMQLQLPKIGPLTQKVVCTQWTQTLAALLQAGVPLMDALQTLAPLITHARFTDASNALKKDLESGARLSQAMKRHILFPPMLVQMCAIGEESGNLPTMLEKAANLMQTELDDQIKGLSQLLEPLIICFLGMTIGLILMALYLPMFQMGEIAG